MPEKMNPEVKPLLVAALRSGEYEQGSGYLNREGAFCCLGVLCDVAVKQHVDIEVDTSYGDPLAVKYGSDTAYLPTEIQNWSGLNDTGDFPADTEWTDSEGYTYTSLIEANDNGKTFDEIADFIEENF